MAVPGSDVGHHEPRVAPSPSQNDTSRRRGSAANGEIPLSPGLLRLSLHGSAIVPLDVLVIRYGLRLRLSDLRLGTPPPPPSA